MRRPRPLATTLSAALLGVSLTAVSGSTAEASTPSGSLDAYMESIDVGSSTGQHLQLWLQADRGGMDVFLSRGHLRHGLEMHNWTFTPDLTLQLFAQPFIASGRYSSFREFAAPRTLKKLVYGRDIGTIAYDPADATYQVDPDGAGPAAPFSFANPDFTDRSMRGTAVLRWEYRPGSTVFFVWTQERAGSDATGDFNFASARGAFFRDRPTNVFQIKATYWIGR